MEMRLSECDTVIFLDFPQDVCVEGIKNRIGKPRQDMPWVESEMDTEFLEFVINYNKVNRPKVLELLGEYSNKNIVILKSRNEAELFLSEIRCNL